MWLPRPNISSMLNNCLSRPAKPLAMLVALLATGIAQPMHAAEQGFTGGVTPSRFELNAKQGDLMRKSIKVYNLGARPQSYNVRTVDWTFTEAGAISFQDELAQDSCREWVRLERHKIKVLPDPQRPRNFRFEVAIPDDLPPRECRFALMIEGVDTKASADLANGSIKLPVLGRIAVIVYVGIGGVEPQLVVGDVSVQKLNNQTLPAIAIENSGNAHGRLDADLVAKNSNGKNVPLTIATSPILPGQTRQMALTPAPGLALDYPLTITGKIYSDGQTITVDQQILSPTQGIIAER